MATERQLLELLNTQSDWIPSGILARKLDISVRTVNNLVKSVNQKAPLVLSSSKGYLLDRELYAKTAPGAGLPQLPEDRIFWLLKSLIYSNLPLDLYDLADSLYISDSTLKNDLKKVKERLETFSLSLIYRKETVACTGSEADKRRFIRDLLNRESSSKFTNYHLIQLSFPEFDVPAVKKLTEETITGHHMFANDYALLNIVLHLCICIKRVKEGFLLTSSPDSDETALPKPYLDIAEELSDRLGSLFHLELNRAEQIEWAVLIENYSTEFAYNGEHTLYKNAADHDLDKIADEIIRRLNSSYYINIEDASFKPRFTLHLRNMMLRSTNNMYARNSMTDMLKSEFPLLYDMSVFVANVFLELTGCRMNDDEIAYIVLHLGSSLNLLDGEQEKIKAALLCPSYYDFGCLLLNKLNAVFHHQMTVTAVITTDLEISSLREIDLLIISYPFNQTAIPSICISPLLCSSDIEKLQNRLRLIQKQKRRTSLLNRLHALFLPELFFYNEHYENEWDAIRMISSRMEDLGLVDKRYQDEVIKRERLSSTAFGCYAMPHSIEMTAVRSSIAVAVTSKPFLWNEKKVNIVFMIALNKDERKLYKDIYSALTELMADDAKMLKITGVTSYEELISQLLRAFS